MQLQLGGKNLCLLSGGKSSFLAAHYSQNVSDLLAEHQLYFNDTLCESPDTYRFLYEGICVLKGISQVTRKRVVKLCRQIPEIDSDQSVATRKQLLPEIAAIVGDHLIYDSDGRTIWEVFVDKRFFANTQKDPCSHVLKRHRRLKNNIAKQYDRHIIGFSWAELDRYEKAKANDSRMYAPLAEYWVDLNAYGDQVFRKNNLQPGSAYKIGLSHDNCSGVCPKAGLGHYKQLWQARPNVYLYAEQKQEELLAEHPKMRPFLRKTINGKMFYPTMKEARLANFWFTDELPSGGCGCAI